MWGLCKSYKLLHCNCVILDENSDLGEAGLWAQTGMLCSKGPECLNYIGVSVVFVTQHIWRICFWNTFWNGFGIRWMDSVCFTSSGYVLFVTWLDHVKLHDMWYIYGMWYVLVLIGRLFSLEVVLVVAWLQLLLVRRHHKQTGRQTCFCCDCLWHCEVLMSFDSCPRR